MPHLVPRSPGGGDEPFAGATARQASMIDMRLSYMNVENSSDLATGAVQCAGFS
jgi:hypothetical protein